MYDTLRGSNLSPGRQDLHKSGCDDNAADDSENPLHATRSSAAALELGTMQLNAEPNLNALTGGGAPSAPSVEKPKKKKLPPPYTSECKYHFERVILDECQYVKNIRTCAHQCITQIPRNALFGLTATTMWNRILDLYGYCSLLTGHLTVKFTKQNPTGGLLGPNDVRYPDLRVLYKAWSDVTILPENSTKIPYELLNPAVLVQLTKDTHGEITTQI
ncbi:Helicase C-terminal [Penicillium cataractarum]|uniref:Helicase C-terminal n=1 Tax=Penicillium cataractarum TaxID=2100454 RepID=A0A9W9VUR1_9EURO|nr:Helicase C-terminal [Penicillium cataractarum]KAJ5389663.1 Helicase C-terminal [Penicillium cataractarum]